MTSQFDQKAADTTLADTTLADKTQSEHQFNTATPSPTPTVPDALALPSTTPATITPAASDLALASYATALPTSVANPVMAPVPYATEAASSEPTATPPLAKEPIAAGPPGPSRAAIANSPPAQTQPAHNLELQIENVRPQRGAIKVAIFTDADNFLNPNHVAQAFELSDATTTASVNLSIDTPCAIAVFQDIDGNGLLTTNRIGIPVEPCGFSNNAVIHRGPPKFSEAMIQPARSSATRPTKASIRLPSK